MDSPWVSWPPLVWAGPVGKHSWPGLPPGCTTYSPWTPRFSWFICLGRPLGRQSGPAPPPGCSISPLDPHDFPGPTVWACQWASHNMSALCPRLLFPSPWVPQGFPGLSCLMGRQTGPGLPQTPHPYPQVPHLILLAQLPGTNSKNPLDPKNPLNPKYLLNAK